jgi:hypothetical protein
LCGREKNSSPSTSKKKIFFSRCYFFTFLMDSQVLTHLPLLSQVAQNKLQWMEYCSTNVFADEVKVLDAAEKAMEELKRYMGSVQDSIVLLRAAIAECKSDKVKDILTDGLKGLEVQSHNLCMFDLLGLKKYVNVKSKKHHVESQQEFTKNLLETFSRQQTPGCKLNQ